jgi:hypothetical protein
MFGKLIYLFIFKIFNFFCNSYNVSTWIRNSYYENYFQSFKSDLDLTIYFNNDDEFGVKIAKIRSLSQYFIIIKEMNYYLPTLLSLSLKCINHYELKRDPHLIKKFGINQNLNNSTSHAFIYLMRHIESSLRFKPILNMRDTKKWHYHLKNTEVHFFDIDFLNRDDLIKRIFNKFNLKESFAQAFTLYLNQTSNDDLYYYEHDFKKELIVLFPHKLCYVSDLSNFQFDSIELSIISSQLQWETWAMATQPWLFTDERTFVHLNNLITMAQTLSLDQEIIHHLKEVTAFFIQEKLL